MDILRTADGIEYLRTPDDRFAQVGDYPYEPHYLDIEGLRMAYVDEGAATSGHTVLLPHGEPTWGYLYRFMIPPLVAAGHRCVVPDLIGFGRSDKPAQRSSYSYDNHVRWMRSFGDQLGLERVTVFCQDWGGLIHLRMAGEDPDRFDRIVAGNTGLPVGESLGPGFDFWLDMSQNAEFLDCGQLVAGTARNTFFEDFRPFVDHRQQQAFQDFIVVDAATGDPGPVCKLLE